MPDDMNDIGTSNNKRDMKISTRKSNNTGPGLNIGNEEAQTGATRVDVKSGTGLATNAGSTRKRNIISWNRKTSTNPQADTMAPHPSESDTFWTACSGCHRQFQYLKDNLNKKLICPNCRKCFVALAKTAPPVNKRKPFSRSGNTGCGSTSAPSDGQATCVPSDVNMKRGNEGAQTAATRENALRRKVNPPLCTGQGLKMGNEETQTGAAREDVKSGIALATNAGSTKKRNIVARNWKASTNPQANTVVPRPSESDTFWTACSSCHIQFQYVKNYLNKKLVCPKCHKCFVALEKTAPPISKRKPFSRSGNIGCGSTSAALDGQATCVSSDINLKRGNEGVQSAATRENVRRKVNPPLITGQSLKIGNEEAQTGATREDANSGVGLAANGGSTKKTNISVQNQKSSTNPLADTTVPHQSEYLKDSLNKKPVYPVRSGCFIALEKTAPSIDKHKPFSGSGSIGRVSTSAALDGRDTRELALPAHVNLKRGNEVAQTAATRENVLRGKFDPPQKVGLFTNARSRFGTRKLDHTETCKMLMAKARMEIHQKLKELSLPEATMNLKGDSEIEMVENVKAAKGKGMIEDVGDTEENSIKEWEEMVERSGEEGEVENVKAAKGKGMIEDVRDTDKNSNKEWEEMVESSGEEGGVENAKASKGKGMIEDVGDTDKNSVKEWEEMNEKEMVESSGEEGEVENVEAAKGKGMIEDVGDTDKNRVKKWEGMNEKEMVESIVEEGGVENVKAAKGKGMIEDVGDTDKNSVKEWEEMSEQEMVESSGKEGEETREKETVESSGKDGEVTREKETVEASSDGNEEAVAMIAEYLENEDKYGEFFLILGQI